MHARSRSRGFTLIEVMVVVVIVAIGASIAAPSFSAMIANMRQKAAASEVHMAMMRARSEAVRINRAVTITPVTAGRWEAGWTIVNPGGSTPFDVHAAFVNTTITGPNSITYQSNGRISATTAPQFEVQTTNATGRRCVQVSLSGRPYQKSTAC